MTLPDERTRAVQYTRRFLRDLLDPKRTPRIPRYVRRMAGILLRHYPGSHDLLIVSNESPKVFSEPEEEPSYAEETPVLDYVRDSHAPRVRSRKSRKQPNKSRR